MARKNKSPLYKITDPTDPDYVEDIDDTTDTETTDENLMEGSIFDVDITQFGSGVQSVDTSGVDEYISQIETPTGTSVWEKQAAYYRQKGEGDVLRMQKDVASLFLPTITLWQEREATANAKFEMMKQQIPEFDDTLIFGEGGVSKTPMPVVDEIKNISTSVKADMKELSRLNVNDPRYDELRKKIEKDQDVIRQFDVINKTLLAIRNDIGEDGKKLGNNVEGDWSTTMDDNEKAMWRDIYNSNGENIKVIDGKLMWVPKDKVSYDFGSGWTQEENIRREMSKMLLTTEISKEEKKKIEAIKHMYYGEFKPGKPGKGKNFQIQRRLVALGYELGDTGKDGDGIDGIWGDKSKKAYALFLKEKDNLATEMFDKYLPEDSEFRVVTTGKNIDLSTIGYGPKMKDGVAWRAHLGNVDILGRGLEGGATPKGNEFQRNAYKALRISIENEFKGMDVEGQASLLFDGIERLDDLDALPVDVFLNDIMANNSDKFPGYKSMNEEQRIEAWNSIRKNGMLETYTLNGKTASLQNHFKDFYMGEVDKKAMAYIPPSKKKKKKKKKKIKSSFAGINTELDEIAKENENVYTALENVALSFKDEEGGVLGYIKQDDGSWKNEDLNDVISGQQLLRIISDGMPKEFDISQLEEFKQYNTTVGHNADPKLYISSITETKTETNVEETEEITNLDHIVDNIWEPNTPEGYGMGENGRALFSYFYNSDIEFSVVDIEEGEGIPLNKTDGGNVLKISDYFVGYSGEYIYVYKEASIPIRVKPNEDYPDKYELVNKWGGDSWGRYYFDARKRDKEDIMEIFKLLGIDSHLTETR